jgi:hypothetical protein
MSLFDSYTIVVTAIQDRVKLLRAIRKHFRFDPKEDVTLSGLGEVTKDLPFDLRDVLPVRRCQYPYKDFRFTESEKDEIVKAFEGIATLEIKVDPIPDVEDGTGMTSAVPLPDIDQEWARKILGAIEDEDCRVDWNSSIFEALLKRVAVIVGEIRRSSTPTA